jgi:hypothetical protein
MNRLIYGLGALMGGIMLTSAILLAVAWYSCTPIFPDAVTSQLRKGMSLFQVYPLLGAPDSTQTLKSGRIEWRYVDSIKPDFVVESNPEGIVQYFYEHD